MATYDQNNALKAPSFARNQELDVPHYSLFVNNEIVETFRASSHEVEALEGVVVRIRSQLLAVVRKCKAWKVRHAGLTGEIELRYSAHEGVLCFQDLKRYWALYRHASRELRRTVARGEQLNTI